MHYIMKNSIFTTLLLVFRGIHILAKLKNYPCSVQDPCQSSYQNPSPLVWLIYK